MKHHDCVCAECRKSTAPTTTITIPLAEVAQVISDSVCAVLLQKGAHLVRYEGRFTESLDGAQLGELLREIGNNTAAALQGLDETPLELPPPRAISARKK